MPIIIDSDGIRMAESACKLNFLFEALEGALAGNLWAQKLNCCLSFQQGVGCHIYLSHTAFSKKVIYFVLADMFGIKILAAEAQIYS